MWALYPVIDARGKPILNCNRVDQALPQTRSNLPITALDSSQFSIFDRLRRWHGFAENPFFIKINNHVLPR
jgi:hypothetical protein